MQNHILFQVIADSAAECDSFCSEITQFGDEYTVISVTELAVLSGNTKYIMTGKISAELATIIVLGNSALSCKIRFSSISDELKDKYRSKINN